MCCGFNKILASTLTFAIHLFPPALILAASVPFSHAYTTIRKRIQENESNIQIESF